MTTAMDRQWQAVLTDGVGIKRATIQLECEAGEVGNARRFAREQLAMWGFPKGGDFNDRIVLAESELVTNAVLHARTRPPGESEVIDIALAFEPGRTVGVLVTDNAREVPLIDTRAPAHATHGRGLLLVNALADGWTAAHPTEPGRRSGERSVGLLPMSHDC